MKVTSIKASSVVKDNDLCINLHNDLFVMMIWVYANGAASITSDLKYNSDETECAGTLQHYNTAIDAIESLVLRHAAAGVDICELPYLVGLETAIDAAVNYTESSKTANEG